MASHLTLESAKEDALRLILQQIFNRFFGSNPFISIIITFIFFKSVQESCSDKKDLLASYFLNRPIVAVSVLQTPLFLTDPV